MGDHASSRKGGIGGISGQIKIGNDNGGGICCIAKPHHTCPRTLARHHDTD